MNSHTQAQITAITSDFQRKLRTILGADISISIEASNVPQNKIDEVIGTDADTRHVKHIHADSCYIRIESINNPLPF